MQKALKMYGKQTLERKKQVQFEAFHGINIKKLEKDYEVIYLLLEKQKSNGKEAKIQEVIEAKNLVEKLKA